MNLRFLLLLLASGLFFSCRTTTYFIVRHAEKAPAGGDAPLSALGIQQAEALKDRLYHEPIGRIYTTNYQRTRSTARPLAEALNLPYELYDPRDTGFIAHVQQLKTRYILIVGHSNTVDDMVNRLAGSVKIPADLPDSAYGDLFIIRRKGKHIRFRTEHFGPSK
jgi:phosphohistidine phosphatase SixA